ncbi:MAG: T9SS type A sorting domain-containing protein [Bacteroidaceae bacterium]|nr:T9SS type A sorting domain-containing protein [Bacteroidaceae bacterium]
MCRILSTLLFVLSALSVQAQITIGGNIYGGGNRGDLHEDTHVTVRSGTITGSVFGGARMADVLATSVTIQGGTIHDVYGGNDISGDVKQGTNVEIQSSIVGSVYGGGNGSYTYTDQTAKKDLAEWADYYYAPGDNSIEALNEYRPHTPKTYVHLSGTVTDTTFIGGGVYCGGNSASLRTSEDFGESARAHLQLGSYVVADKVFLGSDGEDMVSTARLESYRDNSDLDLTKEEVFSKYMEGVAMPVLPEVSVDENYVNHSSFIGSFYCGGNVGSLTVDGLVQIDFLRSIVVYNKIVGGCNNAIVAASPALNAAYEGGITGNPGDNNLKLKLVFAGDDSPELRPMNLTYDALSNKFSFDWHKNAAGNRLLGGNVYGGCYESGYVNGNVEIDIATDLLSETLFTDANIDQNAQNQDVFTRTLTAYGGGYGTASEIRGNTIVNVRNGGNILQVFGGGEKGRVTGNCTINQTGGHVMEIYGGGFEGLVTGNTQVNLDGGTAFDVFGGACNANINGYAETFIGRNGYPIVVNVFGGNDFGGSILGSKTHPKKEGKLTANAYVEYTQGRVDSIFGGCYGGYEYSTDYPSFGEARPNIQSSFVNISTSKEEDFPIKYIFGGSWGAADDDNNDKMQRYSYVLIDAPNLNLATTDVFGSGAFAGLGVEGAPGGSTVDLYSGRLRNVYGASLSGGYVFNTLVNVPATSTIHVNALFGGGKGATSDQFCDADTARVVYHSAAARVDEAIYGGNDHYRRTANSFVDIDVAVRDNDGELIDVYGGGDGEGTVCECTHVNLNSGAWVRNVYGGGRNGQVWNPETMTALFAPGDPKDTYLAGEHNTNVNINTGAIVEQNAYGGGYGKEATVSGATGISLLGGTVKGDLYGGGYGGDVRDKSGVGGYVASTNVSLIGGTVTNAYGGGLEGSVGYHDISTTATTTDILGATNVSMGTKGATNFHDGCPTVERSLYGGGEKGAVYGTANLTIMGGYIGYRYSEDGGSPAFIENLDLQASGDNLLYENGNAFGGGFNEGGTTDFTNVRLYGGIIRNSLYGGGEIAAIGRGRVTASGEQNSVRTYEGTDKAGRTHIEMTGGHVQRDIFGGGRGYSYNLRGAEISGKEFYTDGYVFGQTDVNIYYGEVGTAEGLAKGYGNVFGGGNIGYVYGLGTKTSENTGSPGHYYYTTNGTMSGTLTEDCRVIVEPVSYVLDGQSVTIDGTTYTAGELVPNSALNRLNNKSTDTRWDALDVSGINIRNAVFAGGNVSSGSDKIYANAVTVFGNVTASLLDIYERDLITVGTEHTGGLYGGGNLSLVEGYRELNITNYGTDYYNFENNKEITIEEYYNDLNDRERAYFQLLYKCIAEEGDGGYSLNDQINQETYDRLLEAGNITAEKWQQAGFCTIYAGRLLNTLQRSDFCGVFGSRMVLQGSRDRVTTTADYTDYTINRVGELSLNKNREHGNYFGIYSVVNYLGNLTSDVWFHDRRSYDSDSYQPESTDETYEEWKWANINNRKRNNGKSDNKVALASGVFLELTTENSTGNTIEEKDFGYITGVVELDLINVVPGEGGGYVYAKNQHGMRANETIDNNITLAASNNGAQSFKRYTYGSKQTEDMETSGNFVHNVKSEPIIDDCYPLSGDHTSKAHYWYIKGEIYVYEQTISAYTGSATAYAESVRIPLNITAASNGRLKLINVQPNLYAYWANDNQTEVINGEMKINGVTYHLNDTITYWNYSRLSESNKQRFVPETWVCIKDGIIDGVTYTKGQVVLPLSSEPASVTDKNGEACLLEDILRTSNNLSHSNGYLLTFDMNNPMEWDNWYSRIVKADGDKINTKTYTALSDTDKDLYIEGPTFQLNQAGVHGQRDYNVGDIIPKDVVDNYNNITALGGTIPSTQQATVVRAYVATEELDYTLAGRGYHAEKGADISKTDYDALDPATQLKFTEAFVCTSTITIDEGTNQYVINGTLLSQTDIDSYKNAYRAVTGATAEATDKVFSEHISEAYRCTAAGKYGGKYYVEPKNYSAIDSWCSLADREHFTFNKDAFDILLDDAFGSNFQADIAAYGIPYSNQMPVDYTAVYTGNTDATPHNGITLTHNHEYFREEYEQLPNERYHYSPITAMGSSGTKTYHVVTESFYNGDMSYIAGQVLADDLFSRLKDKHGSKIFDLTLTNSTATDVVYYYCRENYTIGEKGDGKPLTVTIDQDEPQTYDIGETVPKGTIITQEQYETIVNYQQHFTIRGTAPTETSTLYVSRESDIKSLSKDRTYTVIYQYTYDEADDTGSQIDQISELHVVNIHVKFRSGVPIIGDLSTPPTILPGTTIGLTKPSVTEGAYEIMEGGWEMYRNSEDAGLHRNGKSFVPSETQMYWYQDQKYHVAYYAKTFLGKTYSNYVPVSVANYHRLGDVLTDANHLYINHRDQARDPKIYIDGRNVEGRTYNELDGLHELYAIINGDYGTLNAPGNNGRDIRGATGLDFFMQGDITPTRTWTSIGTGEEPCFNGDFHGEGSTITGIPVSLFDKLCGNVWNLGVTGSFTSGGVANTGGGHVENCWVKTTGTPAADTKAVFGSPDANSQVVNCYYPASNSSYTTGPARQMADKAFYNGEVAYNLNGFYLQERYHRGTSTTNADTYVTSRYSDADHDFIYAEGKIPQENDVRMASSHYSPVYPDDYLFFGQMLTYGHMVYRPHQDLPARLNKTEGSHLLYDTDHSNRVYRAPAYFRSHLMEAAHFNPNAMLAACSMDGTQTAYPDMTAIDFTGHNDLTWQSGVVPGGLPAGGSAFYPPLLDNDGLVGVRNIDLTENLLAYSPATGASDAATKTHDVLTAYFTEPAYAESDADYRSVDANTTAVKGHVVIHDGAGDYTAVNDHLLIDKQDFNAPIAYYFADDKRMWYQRVPDNYADISKGWEGISLPFTAELVTTHQKGELTHFYEGSLKGHEYWLREYHDITGLSDESEKSKAIFRYPAATGTDDKECTSTFLWDYYFSHEDQKDENADEYKQYYDVTRTYEAYPLLQDATPYIIGFPGSHYREFDLSGQWTPKHTAQPAPSSLDRQTITFASEPGITIAISDTDTADGTVSHNGYSFHPCYQSTEVAIGGYLLSSDGSSYDQVTEGMTTAEKTALPFRPYFDVTPANARQTRSIVFSNEQPQLKGDDEPQQQDINSECVDIRAKQHRVTVTSHLRATADVRIFSVNGLCIASYDINAGETVETPVHSSGVYIVHVAGGSYRQKIAVK